jgi:LacI family transcriptional regulator
VSATTASFVLAGREDMRISDAARLRVRRAAADLRYRPNLTARSLRTKVTRTVALVSDTIAGGPYGGAMVRGALSAALEEGHLLFVTETGGDPELEARLAEDLLAARSTASSTRRPPPGWSPRRRRWPVTRRCCSTA